MIKLIFFFLTIVSFGFFSTSQIANIKSIILLMPISISFGFAAYILLHHVLSFFIGPQAASIFSLILLFIATLTILVIKHKTFLNIALEINKKQLVTVSIIAIAICLFTFLSVSRIGPFDKEFHIPLALTIHHNNIYPPRDFFRPEYLLLYHYAGDLLAVAIHHICKVDITRAFEIISTIVSGTTFLSFFALAWLLTKNYKLSLLSGFCTYFGGGFLWLDAIFRYLFKKLPADGEHWTLLQTFFSLGIHGSILNAPSVHIFLPTFGLGNILLILSFILFWKMTEENNQGKNITYIIFLSIALITLCLSAEWLYITFWAGVLPFFLILLFKKQKQAVFLTLTLLAISFLLNNLIGNAIFLQDEIQHLGRSNILNIAPKEKLFWISGWGRLGEALINYQKVFFFSWNCISEFGLSLLLFPIIVAYLMKTKNTFALLLFLAAITTMPLPLIIEFKTNPADFNRFFAFGNTVLILLITCSLGTLFKTFLKKRILIVIYLLAFCFSPLSGLISSSVFSPYISTSKSFAKDVFKKFKTIKTLTDIKIFFRDLNNSLDKRRNEPFNEYKSEIEFLKANSKSKDVAISSFYDIPLYAGIYTIIPSGVRVYKDQLYSNFDSTFLTAITTLDPYLLNELNIKWIQLSNVFKDSLPIETKNILNNENLFKPVFVNKVGNLKSNWNEIYQVLDLSSYLKNNAPKTGWVLVNETGQPIEITVLQNKKISLFSSTRSALLYLKSLYKLKPELKKELITSQAIVIQDLERHIKVNDLDLEFEMHGL